MLQSVGFRTQYFDWSLMLKSPGQGTVCKQLVKCQGYSSQVVSASSLLALLYSIESTQVH